MKTIWRTQTLCIENRSYFRFLTCSLPTHNWHEYCMAKVTPLQESVRMVFEEWPQSLTIIRWRTICEHDTVSIQNQCHIVDYWLNHPEWSLLKLAPLIILHLRVTSMALSATAYDGDEYSGGEMFFAYMRWGKIKTARPEFEWKVCTWFPLLDSDWNVFFNTHFALMDCIVTKMVNI